ncbi:MAG: alpha/beta hydrolase [Erysipelotrichaceae bacterium]|nr:alpha/beta hydrolase [Erysipelotrichaceae bacterium]
MKKGTKLLLASGAAALGAHGVLTAQCETVFRKAFIADRTLGERDVIDFLPTEELKERYLDEADEQIEWFRSSRVEELEMRSFDGLFLNAVSVSNHGKEAPVIILIHGYNADRYCLLKQAYEFDKLGYNLLMPDERGYGKSEGKYVTFGQKESLDILQWIDLLIKRDPEVKIGLYGVSMGAEALMCAAGSKLPQNVRFLIEEAGYSDASTVIASVLRKKNIAASLLMPYLERKVKNVLGFSLKEVSAVNALKQNEVPICFIHSETDDVVPPEHARYLYTANKGKKYFYPLEDAPHAYGCYTEGYFKTLQGFIERSCN